MNFLLLVLKILLDLSSDADHKGGKFSETLPKKNIKFFPNGRNGIIVFKLSLVLLSVKVDLISEKQGCKKNTLGAHDTSYIEIVLILSTEVITLYIRATIIQVKVSGLKSPIFGCRV